jgi:hypothetical protein
MDILYYNVETVEIMYSVSRFIAEVQVNLEFWYGYYLYYMKNASQSTSGLHLWEQYSWIWLSMDCFYIVMKWYKMKDIVRNLLFYFICFLQ